MKENPLDTMVQQDVGDAWQAPYDRLVLEQYQLNCLQETIDYAKTHSIFYRQSLAGISVSDINDLTALDRLPLISAATIQNNGQQMLCVSQDEVARIITMMSSGTTGDAKRLYFTAQDLERTVDFFYHGMQLLVQPGGRAAILLPSQQPDSTGNLLTRALERLNVSSLGYGLVDRPLQAVREIFSTDIQTIIGFPVQVLALARSAAEAGIQPQGLQSVLLCSDYIPQVVCRELESLWHCSVFKHYGAVESGLGGAVECHEHRGCHIRENDMLIEIINPWSGKVLGEDCLGEIVLTTLRRQAMPMIRYRTGDYGSLVQNPCSCGSRLFRLDHLNGRIGQQHLLGTGQTLSLADLDEALLQVPGLLDFKGSLELQREHDLLTLDLVCLPGRQKNVTRKVKDILASLTVIRGIQYVVAIEEHQSIQPAKRTIQDNRNEYEKLYSTTL